MPPRKRATDPFDDNATDTTEETTTVTDAPWENPAAPASTEVSVTLKGGPGYDEPWVVLRGGDVPAAAALVNDTVPLKDLLDGTRKAADYFHTTRKAPAPGAAAPAAPVNREGAPGGETKQCQHGSMQYKSGVSASTGRAWKAWMCPTAKGTPGQCPPEFIR